MHDLPNPEPAHITMYSYADDLTILAQHPKYTVASRNLQNYLNTLEEWLTENRMSVSPQKSSVTLLTPDLHESSKHPVIRLDSQPIPFNKTSIILDLT